MLAIIMTSFIWWEWKYCCGEYKKTPVCLVRCHMKQLKLARRKKKRYSGKDWGGRYWQNHHGIPGTWHLILSKWMQPTPRGRAHFVIWRMLLPPPRTRGMCWPADSLAGFRGRCNPSSLLDTPVTACVASWLKNKDEPWLPMPTRVSRRYVPSSMTCPCPRVSVTLSADGPSLLQDGCVIGLALPSSLWGIASVRSGTSLSV